MKNRLSDGDSVMVVMSRDDVLPRFQSGEREFLATYRWGPHGPGDTFRLDVGDIPLHLNGNSESFVGMYRLYKRTGP